MCFLKDVTLPDYKTNYKTINDLFQVFQPGGEGGREKEEKMSKNNIYTNKYLFQSFSEFYQGLFTPLFSSFIDL